MNNLLLENNNGILIITINRESKLNALNREVLSELHQAFADAFNDPETGGIIITGAGSKAFVAGADITEFSGFNAVEGRELARKGHTEVFNFIENGNKPIIAAINGFALGGGLELALACHMRVAADTAKMGLPEVGLGLIPGYGGTQRLSRLIGKGRALEMILTGEMIDAEQAFRTGLANHIVAPDQLLEKCREILTKTLSKSPLAIARAISAVNSGSDATEGLNREIEEFGACFGSDDFREGVSAFLEKRTPVFRNKA